MKGSDQSLNIKMPIHRPCEIERFSFLVYIFSQHGRDFIVSRFTIHPILSLISYRLPGQRGEFRRELGITFNFGASGFNFRVRLWDRRVPPIPDEAIEFDG